MTRGGKLTILNCLLWAAVAVGVGTDTPLLLWPALVACWPLAWLFILPVFGRVTPVGPTEVMACIMIGINSFFGDTAFHGWCRCVGARALRSRERVPVESGEAAALAATRRGGTRPPQPGIRGVARREPPLAEGVTVPP